MKILERKILQDTGMGENLFNMVLETKHECKNRQMLLHHTKKTCIV